MTVDPSPANDTASGCSTCDLLRKRLYDLEEAAENYIEVVTETGERRMAAMAQLQAALTSDFRTAILTSHDMKDEDRAFWLAESDKHEAALSAAQAPEAAVVSAPLALIADPVESVRRAWIPWTYAIGAHLENCSHCSADRACPTGIRLGKDENRAFEAYARARGEKS